MALIRSFEELPAGGASVHRPVHCGWKVFREAGVAYLQMDTYGSVERKMQGKVSQSIQMDAAGARNLHEILIRAFPELRRG